MKARVIVEFVWVRQRATGLIDAAMDEATLRSIRRFRPFTLHPFKVSQPRTIFVLVDHSRRQQWHIAGYRWKWQWEFELRGIFEHGSQGIGRGWLEL